MAAWVVALVLVHALGFTHASAEGDDGGREGALSARAEDAARVRKNVTALTPIERREFVEAVLALKSAPSPYDARLSYYDQFVAWHLSLYPCAIGQQMVHAHGGPMFLPWHRLFLLRFEDALREVSGKPITVPYWDWADPTSTASVFAADLMGGDGDPDEDFAVTTGPFRKGKWALRVQPVGMAWASSATAYITRRFGSFAPMPTLPTREDVAFLLGRPMYDVAPFDAGSDPNLSFRNALEGFWRQVGAARVTTGSASMVCGPDGVMMATGGENTHNRVHGWVGGSIGTTPEGIKMFGTMLLPTSPNDPVFFLHHANIDRLWARWQEVHGVDSYEPVTCTGDLLEGRCRGNARTDAMHPPFDASPSDVADIGALGYSYDDASAAVWSSGTSEPAAPAAATVSLRCERSPDVR